MLIEEIGNLEKEAFSKTVIPGIRCIKLSAPIAVQYEVTENCNQGCVFCYNVWRIDSNKPYDKANALPLNERLKIVKKIIALNVFEVILSGGEPLLVPEIHKIVAELANANIKTYLITNGIFLNNELTSNLKTAGLSGIQISLHGSKPEIHDAVTQRSGSFNETINGIKNALEVLGNRSVNVNMVLMKGNCTDVETIMKMLYEIGVIQFSLSLLSETGLASSKMRVTKNVIINSLQIMTKLGNELNLSVGIAGGFPYCLFPRGEQEQVMKLSANICDAGLNQLVISPEGNIRACVCFPQILGNILKDDPIQIWKESPFINFLQQLKHVPPRCYDCDLVAMCKGGCRAAAYRAYNNFQEIDPIIEEVPI